MDASQEKHPGRARRNPTGAYSKEPAVLLSLTAAGALVILLPAK